MRQKNRVSRQMRLGLLWPLPILERPWTSASMEIIVKLPVCEGYDNILVVFDCLTK